jgi:hypothetical protein
VWCSGMASGGLVCDHQQAGGVVLPACTGSLWVQGFRPGTVVITGADLNPGRKIVALRLLRSTWAGFTSGGSPLHRPGEEGLGGDSGFSGPSQSLYVLASPRGSQAPEPINLSPRRPRLRRKGASISGRSPALNCTVARCDGTDDPIRERKYHVSQVRRSPPERPDLTGSAGLRSTTNPSPASLQISERAKAYI